MSDERLVGMVADALVERFKKRVANHADKPFDETEVSIPNREIWIDYANAAIDLIEDEHRLVIG